MSRGSSTGRERPRAARLLVTVTAAAALTLGTLFVWFLGFDPLWALTGALAVGSVGAAISLVGLDDPVPWDAPSRKTPRSTRLSVALIERSLAACDRLESPVFLRHVQRLAHAEREDRQSRLVIVRRMRALIIAELRRRGLDATSSAPSHALSMLGSDAVTILESHDGDGVSTAVVTRCLDALERLTPAS